MLKAYKNLLLRVCLQLFIIILSSFHNKLLNNILSVFITYIKTNQQEYNILTRQDHDGWI